MAETPQSVDYFDADRFVSAPNKILKLQGREYVLSGDPDCDLVAAIVRADLAMRNEDGAEVSAAIVQGKQLFVALLRETNEDVPDDIRIGVGRVSAIFEWLIGGESPGENEPVQAQVGEALSGGLTKEEQDQAIKDMEATGELTDADAEPGPLAKPSTKRSSRSEGTTSGRPTTGGRSRGGSSKSTSAKRAAAQSKSGASD